MNKRSEYRIYKYSISNVAYTTISRPVGAQILSVKEQKEKYDPKGQNLYDHVRRGEWFV
jgi:hypothetical protein